MTGAFWIVAILLILAVALVPFWLAERRQVRSDEAWSAGIDALGRATEGRWN